MSYLISLLKNPNKKHAANKQSAICGKRPINMTSNSNSIHAIIAGVQ